MKKRFLLKLALCAFVATLPIGAWAADVTWTFNNWSSDTKTNLAADAAKNSGSGDKWVNNNTSGIYNYYAISASAAVDNVTFAANDIEISEMTTTLGTLSFNIPKSTSNGRIMIDTRNGSNALRFASASEKVNVPGLAAGKKITISCKSRTTGRTMTMVSGNTNVVAYNQELASDGLRTEVFIVNSSISSATTVSFNASFTGAAANVDIYYITVSDATAQELAIANFGSDDYVTATTLWTFDQYFANDNITANADILNYGGLYMKPHAAKNLSTSGFSTRTSVYGSTTINTNNYCNVQGGHVMSLTELKYRKTSTQTIADCMVINIGTPGKLYIEGSLGAENRRIEVYKGNSLSNLTEETLSNLKVGTLTATGAWSDESALEVTVSEPGTYWISGNYTTNVTTETGCAHRIYSIMFVPTTADVATKTVNISAAGYASFCAPQNYRWSTTDYPNLKAYRASNVTATQVTLTEIPASEGYVTIPACTGVILASGETTAQTYTLTTTETAGSIGENMLKANLAAYNMPASGTISSTTYYNYLLQAGPSFNPSSGSGTLAAGKAFLRTTQEPPSSGAPSMGLELIFDEPSATGIAKLSTPVDTQDGKIYNLQGVEVKTPVKGLYIVNGKKVVIK